MAWRWICDKPLSEPMLTRFTDACMRPRGRWVKSPPGIICSLTSSAVHGSMVTKWLHFICTIYSPWNFNGVIWLIEEKNRMREVLHNINICPTIFKPARFFHRFWWWHANYISKKNENFYVGTWILFSWQEVTKWQSKHRLSQGSKGFPSSTANHISAECAKNSLGPPPHHIQKEFHHTSTKHQSDTFAWHRHLVSVNLNP